MFVRWTFRCWTQDSVSTGFQESHDWTRINAIQNPWDDLSWISIFGGPLYFINSPIILQSFGPAVVSNNCSFSGQNITTIILTYKKHYTLQENCSYGGMASSTSISIRLPLKAEVDIPISTLHLHGMPIYTKDRTGMLQPAWEISRCEQMFPLYDYSKHSNLLDKHKEENVHTQYIHIHISLEMDLYIYIDYIINHIHLCLTWYKEQTSRV